jgi:hypothetical protein
MGLRWIPGRACGTLESCRQGADFIEETGAHFDAQAHISTQPPSPREEARIQGAYEDQERGRCVEPAPRGGPQARICQRWLSRLAAAVT